uniref:Uncharacterized protein n=1 Tax=Arundo donax TaxID=35708 RepID=A0A0A9AND2_ARUDO
MVSSLDHQFFEQFIKNWFRAYFIFLYYLDKFQQDVQ